MPAVYISVGRIAVLYVPLALVGMPLFGIAGIFAAYAIANIVSGIVAYQWARVAVQRQMPEPAAAVNPAPSRGTVRTRR